MDWDKATPLAMLGAALVAVTSAFVSGMVVPGSFHKRAIDERDKAIARVDSLLVAFEELKDSFTALRESVLQGKYRR